MNAGKLAGRRPAPRRPDDPPTNAGIAGHGGISVGAIAADRNNSRACAAVAREVL